MDQNSRNTADARLVKGLIARLEMDAGLGMEYAFLAGGIDSIASLDPPAAKTLPAPSRGQREQRECTPAPLPASPHMQTPPHVYAPVAPAASAPRAREDFVSLVPFTESRPNPEKEAALAALRTECMACAGCELCERRNSVVWGEGSLDAKIMFIGEGPGRDEDAEGRPFVGRSGRLLTDIIEKGMKLPRNEVYIANVVKCRPPGNRDPKPDEAAACSRYLTRQIEVIQPAAIVAVGNVAGRALLGLDAKASGLRGKWFEYQGIPMRVIYHPSYLLRQRRGENDRTEADRATWKDVQEVMARLGETAAASAAPPAKPLSGALSVLLCVLSAFVSAGCEQMVDLDQKGANQSLVEIGERAIELAEGFENEGRSAEAYAEYKRALWAFRYHQRLTGEEPFLLEEAADGVERRGRR